MGFRLADAHFFHLVGLVTSLGRVNHRAQPGRSSGMPKGVCRYLGSRTLVSVMACFSPQSRRARAPTCGGLLGPEMHRGGPVALDVLCTVAGSGQASRKMA